MYELIKDNYGTVFNDADVANFVSFGWITQAQANEIRGKITPTA